MKRIIYFLIESLLVLVVAGHASAADVKGDFDGDWDVDGDDLAVFAGNFGNSMSPEEIDLSKARSLPLNDNTIRFENVLIDGVPNFVEYMLSGGTLVETSRQEIDTFEIPWATISIDGNSDDWYNCSYDEDGNCVYKTSDVISPYIVDPPGDLSPDNGAGGTDIRCVHVARDDSYLYVAFTMHDGINYNTMYILELKQHHPQVHSPGDTIITLRGNNLCISQRGGNCLDCPYGTSYYRYRPSGLGFLEYKVPISDIEYDPGWGVVGIEDRFIRTYTHNIDDTMDENNALSKMVVNFY